MKTKYHIILLLIFAAFFSFFAYCNQENSTNYLDKISAGHFSEAEKEIRQILSSNTSLTDTEKRQLEFEIERMSRIRKDFNQTESDVLAYVRRYLPDVTVSDLRRWEDERSLEYFMIDGDKRYFKYAGRNLFRIDADCEEIWKNSHNISSEEESFNLKAHIQEVVQMSQKKDLNYVNPVKIQINYGISVKKGEVPSGKTIRCWIPFPREIEGKQYKIKLLNSEPAEYQLADNQDCLQRTIYFEKPSEGDQETKFSVSYEFTSLAAYYPLSSETVRTVSDMDNFSPYLTEDPPHIVFTPELKDLSANIVGDEQNPYKIARSIYAWIDENIPWASAREYSTIRNLSQYCYENMHGDCGIKAMLLITLLRMNGIPARWQSGWEFQPPHHNMHDWGMAYFEPFGWVPVDVDYGLQDSEEDQVKWFYLGGIDSYRLVFNDSFSQALCPEKQHFRSETIDSQRGELEWDGGNLYFDQWSWTMQFQVLED